MYFFLRFFPKSWPNPPKNHQKSSQDMLKSSPNPLKPFKSHPQSIQKAFSNSSWTNALWKIDFERPINSQEASKSSQKRPKGVPKPAQIEPKTLPKASSVRILDGCFPSQNLHRILMDFLQFFKASRP